MPSTIHRLPPLLNPSRVVSISNHKMYHRPGSQLALHSAWQQRVDKEHRTAARSSSGSLLSKGTGLPQLLPDLKETSHVLPGMIKPRQNYVDEPSNHKRKKSNLYGTKQDYKINLIQKQNESKQNLKKTVVTAHATAEEQKVTKNKVVQSESLTKPQATVTTDKLSTPAIPPPIGEIVTQSKDGVLFKANSKETDQLLREIRGLPSASESLSLTKQLNGKQNLAQSRLDRLNEIHEKAQNGTLVKHVLSKVDKNYRKGMGQDTLRLAPLEHGTLGLGSSKSTRSNASSRRSSNRSNSSSMILLARDQNRIIAARHGENDPVPSNSSSHRWNASINPNNDLDSESGKAMSHRSGRSNRSHGTHTHTHDGSVAGSAGEEVFHQEIRNVVEQEVVKLLAPLEMQLRSEREKRELAEKKLKEISNV